MNSQRVRAKIWISMIPVSANSLDHIAILKQGNQEEGKKGFSGAISTKNQRVEFESTFSDIDEKYEMSAWFLIMRLSMTFVSKHSSLKLTTPSSGDGSKTVKYLSLCGIEQRSYRDQERIGSAPI